MSGDTEFYDSLMLGFVDSVDKPLRLYARERYQLLVTASDVIHSFAVPELGLKADAIPGRVNQIYFLPAFVGVFVGYCRNCAVRGMRTCLLLLRFYKRLLRLRWLELLL